MPRGGIKGNKGRENPKLRSDNMAALMTIEKQEHRRFVYRISFKI